VVIQGIQGLIRQGLDFDEPLGGEQRLHGHLAAIAVGHRVVIVFGAHQEAIFL
jgi:predicted thioesterase